MAAVTFTACDRIIGGIAKLIWAGNLKQAPHIKREQGQNDRHDGQKQWLLELNAPADCAAGQFDANQDRGNHPEGCDDPGRTGQKSDAHTVGILCVCLECRHHLD